jgi:S-methylmethionine-dependent homocysteine/selenocysteine methylase
MSRAGKALPQLDGSLFVTDGGMETTLIFRRGHELPHFAAFTLLADEAGETALRTYYEGYLAVAEAAGVGLLLDTATWRANGDWAALLGYADDDLVAANARAVGMLTRLRAERGESYSAPLVVNGAVGPRGDGYRVTARMSSEESERYHTLQVAALDLAGADMLTALTMSYAEEAVGVTRAAASQGIPLAVSFTVETDGRLPSGQPLAEAVEQVDGETDGAPIYFMVNCAHPAHFADVLASPDPALERIRGVRANASTKSHAELDEAEELDDGDPASLAEEMLELRRRRPTLNILGGCCGTDERHIGAIASAAATDSSLLAGGSRGG